MFPTHNRATLDSCFRGNSVRAAGMTNRKRVKPPPITLGIGFAELEAPALMKEAGCILGEHRRDTTRQLW